MTMPYRACGTARIASLLVCLLAAGPAISLLAQAIPDDSSTSKPKKEPDRTPVADTLDAEEMRRFKEGLRRAQPAPMFRTGATTLPPKSTTGQVAAFNGITRQTEFRDATPEMTAATSQLFRREPQAARLPMAQDGNSVALPPGPGVMERLGTATKPDSTNGNDAAAGTPPGALSYTYNYPFNTVYKLLMRFNVGGTDYFYVCSAASISSFHLLTAGHCIYNRDPNRDGSTADAQWAHEVWAWAAHTDLVNPTGDSDFRDYPYGVAKSYYYVTYNAWINSGDWNWDIAWMTLDRRMGDHTGWMGREANVSASSLNFSGYPTETPYVPAGTPYQYYGYDAGNVRGYTANRIQLDAYVYGGHSGGPEWRYDGTNRYIQGVNSTSNRVGYAEGTRIHPGTMTDIQNGINADNTARPPVARPDLIEYVFGSGHKQLLTGSVTPGGAANVKYNVYNAGFAASDSVSVDFYLSSNTTITTSDQLVATRSLGALGANSYWVLSTGLTIPVNTPPGTYYVGWIMRSSTTEYNTDNNAAVIGDATLTVTCASDIYESDNTAGTAKVLPIGATQNRSLCQTTDQDWARFTLSAPSAVTLTTNGTSGDTLLYLYNSALTQIAFDDDSGNGYFSNITRACGATQLAAGTYYVRVSEYGANDYLPNYTLSLSASTCAPAFSTLTVNPDSVVGGSASRGTVTLASAAPAGGAVIALSRNNSAATVPASVTVPAGATTATFPISTRAVGVDTPVVISATYNGTTRTTTLTVESPELQSLTLSPNTMEGGETSTANRVNLTGPAPAGGLVITLSSSNTSLATVPATVVVPAGASSSVNFSIVSRDVRATTTVNIRATFSGETRTRVLTLTP